MHEYPITLRIPDIIHQVYTELQNTPFYKVDNGYMFASHTLTNDEQPTNLQKLMDDNAPYVRELDKAKTLFKTTIEILSSLILKEEDVTAWVSFRKENGTIHQYHDILEKTYQDIILMFFECDMIRDKSINREYPDPKPNHVYAYCDRDFIALRELPATIPTHDENLDDYILNHNNPFADVSIKDQSFLYPSDYEQFEVLSLNTSHTLTKVQKDEDRAYLALQPGFKIKKARTITPYEKQTVIFDNTLTTEITQQDDNIYIYVD